MSRKFLIVTSANLLVNAPSLMYEIRSDKIEVSTHAKVWRIYAFRKDNELNLQKDYEIDKEGLWDDEDYEAYKKFLQKEMLSLRSNYSAK